MRQTAGRGPTTKRSGKRADQRQDSQGEEEVGDKNEKTFATFHNILQNKSTENHELPKQEGESRIKGAARGQHRLLSLLTLTLLTWYATSQSMLVALALNLARVPNIKI